MFPRWTFDSFTDSHSRLNIVCSISGLGHHSAINGRLSMLVTHFEYGSNYTLVLF